jgi:hypothetical protein
MNTALMDKNYKQSVRATPNRKIGKSACISSNNISGKLIIIYGDLGVGRDGAEEGSHRNQCRGDPPHAGWTVGLPPAV